MVCDSGFWPTLIVSLPTYQHVRLTLSGLPRLGMPLLQLRQGSGRP